MIDSTTNYVEHPELVAQRLINFAGVVSRERVIASSDCGFGTLAGLATVAGDMTFAKLAAMAEGARLASGELWHGQPADAKLTTAQSSAASACDPRGEPAAPICLCCGPR